MKALCDCEQQRVGMGEEGAGGVVDLRPGRVLVDARMICHSGIGVHLRETLSAMAVSDLLPRELVLLGEPDVLLGALPHTVTDGARLIPYRASLYGWREQWLGLRVLPGAASEGNCAVGAGRGERGPAILHCPHYPIPLGWRGPLSVTIHDLIHTESPPRAGAGFYQGWMLRLIRRRLRRARAGGVPTYAQTVSVHVKTLLQRVWKFPAERLWLNENGINGVYRAPLCAEEAGTALSGLGARLGLPSRYWLSVGIHKPHKNLPWLIEALKDAWASGLWPDVGLVMAGTQQASDLAALANASEVTRGRVRLIPPVSDEDLRTLYWGAEALVFPSLHEGFGLPVAEAMACATPVVCSRRPPMTAIASGAAWWFEPDDRNELKTRLGELTPEGCPPRWRREVVSEQGVRLAKGLERGHGFSWAAAARRQAALWRQIEKECAGVTREVRSP